MIFLNLTLNWNQLDQIILIVYNLFLSADNRLSLDKIHQGSTTFLDKSNSGNFMNSINYSSYIEFVNLLRTQGSEQKLLTRIFHFQLY